MKFILRWSVYCLTLMGLLSTALAQTTGIIEERLFFPVRIEGQDFQLEAMVYRPDDSGRHPLVVFSHGRNGLYPGRNPNQVRGAGNLCRALAAEGLVVTFFTRRGYGNSDGPDTEIQDTAVNTGLEAAKDYQAAVEFWRGVGYVDPDRVVIMGISQGGWAVLAGATVPMDGVLGVVNLSGGTNYALMGSGAVTPAVEDHWVAGCTALGPDALVPSFWIHSENDLSISGPTVRRMFEAYNGAGGLGFLLMLPPFGTNGHTVGSAPSVFLPQLNDFFATIGFRDEPTGAPSIVLLLGGGVFSPGNTSVMTVQLTANPLPSLQWRKDGVDLQNGGNISGATSSALSIFNVQLGDTGDYTVVATNSEGSVTSGPIPVSLATAPTPTPTPTPTPSAPSRGSGGGGGGGAPSTWFISVLALVVTVRWVVLRSRAGATLF